MVDTCTLGGEGPHGGIPMPKSKPPYPPEFRAEAIRLARMSGKPPAQMAGELGMTSETLRLWLKQADLDEGKRSDGLASHEQEELRRLRREHRIVREEREILKKAAAQLPRRRPARSGERLRVCGARAGQPCRRPAVPCARRLPERLVGVVQARAFGTGASRRPTCRADPHDPPGTSWHLWRAACPRGI